MRIGSTLLLGAGLLALAACDVRTTGEKDKNVHIAMDGAGDGGGKAGVSVSIPGLDAKVNLPDLDIASHMDMDGVTLAPGTKVRTVDVDSSDRNGAKDGQVKLAFANRAPAADVLAHYRQSLTAAGYAIDSANAGGIAAHKADKNFALTLAGDGAGSAGTILITGK